ncbi:MAG: hypothetical protein NUV42_03085 [Candidatus Yonathbacteria bacterium]|nr:hypothetical protein [Candidatus Yonathbacteria bacterium]
MLTSHALDAWRAAVLFGDTRGWEFYAQRTQKELSKLLRQPDLPVEAREKASDLFSWLGDKA